MRKPGIHGDTVYTMSGAAISDAIVVIKDGKIAAIGKADDVNVPEGFELLKAKVVTPGLIDCAYNGRLFRHPEH